jgi:two-component system OmpR family response regulator
MRTRLPARPLSVLVVDDYPDSAASLALVLNFEGFAARAAMSREEAMAAAAAEPPEVVVIEPRTFGGGWDLVRQLTGPVAGSRTFLVVLTSDSTAAGRERADANGVGLYCLKPQDPAYLVRALRTVGAATGGRPGRAQDAMPTVGQN